MLIGPGFKVDVGEIRSEDVIFGHGRRDAQVEIEFAVERPVADLWADDFRAHKVFPAETLNCLLVTPRKQRKMLL